MSVRRKLSGDAGLRTNLSDEQLDELERRSLLIGDDAATVHVTLDPRGHRVDVALKSRHDTDAAISLGRNLGAAHGLPVVVDDRRMPQANARVKRHPVHHFSRIGRSLPE